MYIEIFHWEYAHLGSLIQKGTYVGRTDSTGYYVTNIPASREIIFAKPTSNGYSLSAFVYNNVWYFIEYYKDCGVMKPRVNTSTDESITYYYLGA